MHISGVMEWYQKIEKLRSPSFKQCSVDSTVGIEAYQLLKCPSLNCLKDFIQ